jgi:hypothetical protein
MNQFNVADYVRDLVQKFRGRLEEQAKGLSDSGESDELAYHVRSQGQPADSDAQSASAYYIHEGALHILLAMGMKSWLQVDSDSPDKHKLEFQQELFNRLRGSAQFARAVDDFVPYDNKDTHKVFSPFTHDAFAKLRTTSNGIPGVRECDQLAMLGYNIAAFRATLTDDYWMLRTYTIDHSWLNLGDIDVFSKRGDEEANRRIAILSQLVYLTSAQEQEDFVKARRQEGHKWLKYLLNDTDAIDDRAFESVKSGLQRLQFEFREEIDSSQPLQALWLSFSYHVRLSRIGLIEVHLQQDFPIAKNQASEDAQIEVQSIQDVLEWLIKLRTRLVSSTNANENQDSRQWRLALHCAKLYLTYAQHSATYLQTHALDLHNPHKLQVVNDPTDTQPATDGQARQIAEFSFHSTQSVGMITQMPSAATDTTSVYQQERFARYRLTQLSEPIVAQQRYIIFELRNVSRKHNDDYKNPIVFSLETREPFLQLVAQMLEGFIIRSDDGFESPRFDEAYLGRLRNSDLGNWQKEVCVFTSERAVIAYPDANVMMAGADNGSGDVKGSHSDEALPYRDYWRVIIRGIAHEIAVREALQLVANETSNVLAEVPRLTEAARELVESGAEDKLADDRFKVFVRRVGEFSQRVANAVNMLVPLRKIMVTTSTFRADYAVDKFHFLSNSALKMDLELSLVERNIEDLEDFLEYLTAVQQRYQSTLISIKQQKVLEAQNESNEQQASANREQEEANRLISQQNLRLTIFGLIFAAVTIIFGIPTLLNDYRSAYTNSQESANTSHYIDLMRVDPLEAWFRLAPTALFVLWPFLVFALLTFAAMYVRNLRKVKRISQTLPPQPPQG